MANNFLQTYSLAHYDPISRIVMLSSIERWQFEEADDFVGLLNLLTNKNLKVAIHECRHHHDCIGTVWGAFFQKKIFDAFHQSMNYTANPDPNNLDKISNLISEISILNIDILNFHKENIEFLYGWDGKLNLIIRELNNVKFPVFVFYNDQKEVIAHYSITGVCLLETNAISEEIWLHVNLSKELDVAERRIEDDLYYSKEIQPLFSHDTIIYSIIPLIVERHWNNLHIADMYIIGSQLSTLTLNIFDCYSKLIPIPKVFLNSGVNEKDLSQNLGILFLIIIQNYIESKSYNPNKFDINDLLAANSLPSLDELTQNADEVFDSVDIAEDFALATMFDLTIYCGKKVLNSRSIIGSNKSTLQVMGEENHTIPSMLFGDDYWDIDPNSILNKKLTNISLSEWYELVELFKKFIGG